MIKKLLGSFLINIFSLYACAQFIQGFHLPDKSQSLLLVVGAFTIIHLFLRPLLDIFIKALNFLTLGLIGLVLDALILYALTVYFPQLSITSWNFPGLNLGSLVLAARPLNMIETTVACAFFINTVRSFLLWIFF